MSKQYISKILFVIIFLLIVFASLSAQSSYKFKNFAYAEKLSSSMGVDFFQDSYGFMWILTSDGLNRFDGKTVKIYRNKPGNEKSLPDSDTYTMIEDRQKNLWVACYNAFGKLERKTNTFKRYSLDNLIFKKELLFYESLLDKDGGIWFTSSQLGVIRYNREKDYFENIELSKKNTNVSWGEVHAIVQLKNGVIIVADFSNGLKRYNAETNMFDPYYLKPDYSPKKINVIHENKAGNILFGGDNILFKYSPSQGVFKKYDMSQFSKIKSNNNQISSIVEDDENNLWINQQTHGLLKLSKKMDNAEQFIFKASASEGIMENTIKNVFKDKYGIIWLSFMNGGIQQLDLNSNSFAFIPLNLGDESFNNRTIVTDIEGSPFKKSELLLGTTTEGIVRYDLQTNKFNKLNIKDNASRLNPITSAITLKIDNLGNIWFASKNSSLKKLDHLTGKISSYKPSYYKNISVPQSIASLNVSPIGDVWVASNLGIDKFIPTKETFIPISRIMNKRVDKVLKSLVSNVVKTRKPLSSIIKAGDGVSIDSSFRIETKQKILLVCLGEGKSITQRMYDYGSLYGDNGKAIWAFDNINNSFYAGGGFKNRISFKCFELKKGNYKLHFQSDVGHYFGNFNTIAPPDSNWWGIQAFAISDEEFNDIHKLNNTGINENGYLPFEEGQVIEFSKKYSNTIWIGTYLNSFFKYDLESGNYKQYNFDSTNNSNSIHFITAIYEDLKGILWVGTYTSLIRLNPETEELNIYSTPDGIPGGIINSIVEDNFGSLWISSSGGLSKLNTNVPLDKYVFVNYDSKDGLESLTNYRNRVWKDEDGKMFYSAKGGIISFTPGNVNTTKPDIVVSDLKVNDISIFTDASAANFKKSILDTKEIKLSHFQNNISFEFASIHFSRPAKNKTAYMLNGFNNKWYESGRNFASFTNLDPGEYVFRVKGSNGDGIWNEEGRSISIIITPPWWKTTFAYILYAFVIVGVFFVIDRVQRRRILSKERNAASIKEAELRAKAAEAQSKLIQAENDRKTKELEEARQLQLSMLPKELPNIPNLDIAVYMQTATEVGGDYYDFHVGMDGTLTVVVGDATGHGLNAGTIVTATKSLFSSYANNPDILFTFSEISRVIKGMKFHQLTMCLMLIKIKENDFSVSSAAMPPALIYRKKNQAIEEIFMKGMPLGAMKDFPYTLKESQLEQGDTILLLTDGLPELTNDNNEMYGYDRAKTEFHSMAEKEPEEIINHLKKSASQWVNGKDPDDDVTFVVIKVK